MLAEYESSLSLGQSCLKDTWNISLLSALSISLVRLVVLQLVCYKVSLKNLNTLGKCNPAYNPYLLWQENVY